MARGTLQIIGDRPVILVLELLLDDAGDERTDAAQLRVAERVLRASLCHQLAIGTLETFGYADTAIAKRLRVALDGGEKFRFVKRDLRKQQNQRHRRFLVRRHADCRGDPTRVPAHHLEHENLR